MAKLSTTVLAAHAALSELQLICTTPADKDRCDRVLRGMVALDEEQAAVKSEIGNLIDTLDTGYSTYEVIEDLKSLIKRWDRESRAAVKARERKSKTKEPG